MTVSAMARTPKFVTELTSHPEIFWSNLAEKNMYCSNTPCMSAGARRSGRASSMAAAPSSCEQPIPFLPGYMVVCTASGVKSSNWGKTCLLTDNEMLAYRRHYDLP